MKRIHALCIIFGLIALLVLVSCQLVRARSDYRTLEHGVFNDLIEEAYHEPCGCDTCCEWHYESIRQANPQFRMPPID